MTARPTGGRRLVVLGLAAVAAVAIALAAATLVGGPGRQSETGIVVAVEATSLSDVRSFQIRTTDGRVVDFRVGHLENASTFPPGHIAEHKVSLVPVRVTFVVENGADVAVRIEDGR